MNIDEQVFEHIVFGLELARLNSKGIISPFAPPCPELPRLIHKMPTEKEFKDHERKFRQEYKAKRASVGASVRPRAKDHIWDK